MKTKLAFALGIEFLAFAALLFGAAGTLNWFAGWVFMAMFFVFALAVSIMLIRHDPALLEERLSGLIQKDQPSWDKVLIPIVAILFCGWMALMGFDAVRFRWSTVPLWLEVAGAAGLLVSMYITYATCWENPYLAAVVKIQTDRGHHVVSTGPYAVVRHPLYAAMLLMFPSTALMLGSWYGVAASLVLGAALSVRAVFEERELEARLPGYSDYAKQVRYRLVPFVW
ncbi:MAG: isoprenylcysteine carboxylmethyltransferase family protein [Candidatus Korobacteraceae bacterium]